LLPGTLKFEFPGQASATCQKAIVNRNKPFPADISSNLRLQPRGGRLWPNAKCAEMIMTRVSALKPTMESMYSTVLNVRFKRWLPNAHIAIAESSGMEWKAMAECIVARIVRVIPVFQRRRTEPHRSGSLILLEESKHFRFQTTT
jgi:hypothetical protein